MKETNTSCSETGCDKDLSCLTEKLLTITLRTIFQMCGTLYELVVQYEEAHYYYSNKNVTY